MTYLKIYISYKIMCSPIFWKSFNSIDKKMLEEAKVFKYLIIKYQIK